MIQDLFPHQFYNEFSLKRDAQDNDEVFVFDGNNVLVSGDGENSPLSLPKASSFNQNELTYLFKIDDRAYFLYTGENCPYLDGFSYMTKKSLTLRQSSYCMLCRLYCLSVIPMVQV